MCKPVLIFRAASELGERLNEAFVQATSQVSLRTDCLPRLTRWSLGVELHSVR